MQFRTDPAFREKLKELEAALGAGAADIVRDALHEKHARWKRSQKAKA